MARLATTSVGSLSIYTAAPGADSNDDRDFLVCLTYSGGRRERLLGVLASDFERSIVAGHSSRAYIVAGHSSRAYI